MHGIWHVYVIVGMALHGLLVLSCHVRVRRHVRSAVVGSGGYRRMGTITTWGGISVWGEHRENSECASCVMRGDAAVHRVLCAVCCVLPFSLVHVAACCLFLCACVPMRVPMRVVHVLRVSVQPYESSGSHLSCASAGDGRIQVHV